MNVSCFLVWPWVSYDGQSEFRRFHCIVFHRVVMKIRANLDQEKGNVRKESDKQDVPKEVYVEIYWKAQKVA